MSTYRRLPFATVLTTAAFAALTDLASLGAQPTITTVMSGLANPRGLPSRAMAGTGARPVDAHDIAMLGVDSAQVTQRR